MNSSNSSDITHIRPAVQLQQQFVIRRPTMQDAAAVTGLINICAVTETGTLNMTVAALETIWREGNHRLMTDAWLVRDAAGRVVGYGELECSPTCGAPYVWVYVHPDVQAAGIGALLLRATETRVRQLARQTAGRNVVLRAVVVSFNQGLRRLLHQQGFALVERYWDFATAPPELARIALRAYAPDEDGRQVARYDVYEKVLSVRGAIAQ